MEDKVYYKVSEEELIDLLATHARYSALESGGVDNWECCGEAFLDFYEWYMEEYPDIVKYCKDKHKRINSIMIAKYKITNYEKVE